MLAGCQVMGGAPSELGKAGTGAATPRVDSHAVTKRLQSELMGLMSSADPGISAFPDGDSLFSWLGTIAGGQSTVYEGLTYKLSLKFPTVRLLFRAREGVTCGRLHRAPGMEPLPRGLCKWVRKRLTSGLSN